MTARTLALVLVAALGGVAAARAQVPQPTPQPVPSFPPMPSPAPVVTASPSPAPTGTMPPAETTYRYVWTPTANATPLADTGAPHIREVDLSDRVLVTPGEIRVRVLTNPAVQSVTAAALGRNLEIPRVTPGVFALDGEVPKAPWFAIGHNYDVNITAAVPDGRTSTVTLTLGLR